MAHPQSHAYMLSDPIAFLLSIAQVRIVNFPLHMTKLVPGSLYKQFLQSVISIHSESILVLAFDIKGALETMDISILYADVSVLVPKCHL